MQAMGAVFTAVPRKLTVTAFHDLAERGHLAEDDRVELIEGVMINMAPIGSRHASMVDTLAEMLAPHASGRFRLSIQNPLVLPEHSEPQPDLMLLKPRADRYADRLPGPSDALVQRLRAIIST